MSDDTYGDEQTPQESAPESTGGYDTPAESTSPSEDPQYDVPEMGRVPASELVKGYLRQADYTRKTQAIADRARQFQQWEQEKGSYEEAFGQLREFLKDKQRLSQYLAVMGQEAAPPDQDPNEILTASRAQELLSAREQQLQSTFRNQLDQMRQEILTSTLENQYSEAVNQKLARVGEQFPELRSIPGMEGLIRQAVKSQNPTSIEHALSLFDQAAQYYMKTIDSVAQSRVAKSQKTPLSRGIEPPASATPSQRPESRDYNGIRDPRLRDQVMKDIMRIVSSGG